MTEREREAATREEAGAGDQRVDGNGALVDRRGALKAMAAAAVVPVLGTFEIGEEKMLRARGAAESAVVAEVQGTQYVPKFFNRHEYQTVRVLVDYIIPRDERSGSATDAGVPQYMD